MNDLFAQVVHHGYIFIFLIVLAEALGVPVPAALALVAGGAAVVSGTLRAPTAVVVAVTAMLMGDSLLYVLGSHMGWRLLGFLCRVSVDPETCVMHSAERFYKRGRATLLIAKFIPGLNSMAPPLAGSMNLCACVWQCWIYLPRFPRDDRPWVSSGGTRSRDRGRLRCDCVHRLSCLPVLEAPGLPHRSTDTGR
jgi:membrane protein DedA with SNARE-associated domain